MSFPLLTFVEGKKREEKKTTFRQSKGSSIFFPPPLRDGVKKANQTSHFIFFVVQRLVHLRVIFHVVRGTGREETGPIAGQHRLSQLRRLQEIRFRYRVHQVPDVRLQRMQIVSPGRIAPVQEPDHEFVDRRRGVATPNARERPRPRHVVGPRTAHRYRRTAPGGRSHRYLQAIHRGRVRAQEVLQRGEWRWR